RPPLRPRLGPTRPHPHFIPPLTDHAVWMQTASIASSITAFCIQTAQLEIDRIDETTEGIRRSRGSSLVHL
ncbi:MAG: hypothetical protein ACRDTH_20695, partial [Pseudonocardiaceae bacterium]